MTKRLLALLLALIMTIGLLPCTVFAEELETVTEEAEMESAVPAEVEEIISETTEEKPAAEVTEEEPAAEVVEETASETTAKEPAAEEVEKKPALKLLGLSLATPSKLPQNGAYALTIKNDSNAPAKYTVSVTPNGGSAVTDTIVLEANESAVVAKLNAGDKYSVNVEYPEYYQVKSSVCTFSSDGKSFTFYGGEQTVGADITFPAIYQVYTENGDKEIYVSADEVVTKKRGTSAAADVPKGSGSITYVSKSYRVWVPAVTSDLNSVTYTETHRYGVHAEKNEFGCFAIDKLKNSKEIVAWNKTLELTPKIVKDSTHKQNNEEAINDNVEEFKKLAKNEYPEDEGYTIENVTKAAGTFKEKFNNKNYVYAYQLAKEVTPDPVTCAPGPITLTYTADVPQLKNLPLDVLNAGRYDALQNINADWIVRIIQSMQEFEKNPVFLTYKETNENAKVSDYIREHPDSILDIVPLDALALALSPNIMPAPAAVTLQLVDQKDGFYDTYEKKSFTVFLASNSDMVKTAFARIKLPEILKKEMAKSSFTTTVGGWLDLLYLQEKKETVFELATAYKNLHDNSQNVINSIQDPEVKDYATTYIPQLDSALKSSKETAQTMLDTNNLAENVSELLRALDGIELPIRVGYTYNFADVRPGVYEVTLSDVASGWTAPEKTTITVYADGSVEGLEERQAAELDVLKPIDLSTSTDLVALLYCQLRGNKANSIVTARAAIQIFLYDENNNPPALFRNEGIWLNGGSSAGMATGNSIQFTAVTPEGTPLPGVTYMLINRDQLLKLMSSLIALGEGVFNQVSGGMPFSELVDNYSALISGGNTAQISKDFIAALVGTAQNLKNLPDMNLPLILQATSDTNGLVSFSREQNASIKGLFDTAGLTVSTAKDLGDTVVGIINNTLVVQINRVKGIIGQINTDYYKPALQIKDNITKRITDFTNAWKDFFGKVSARMKSFFGGLVTVAKAEEIPTGIDAWKMLLGKLADDAEVARVIFALYEKVQTISGITAEFGDLDEAIKAAEKAKTIWEKYNSNPTKPSSPPITPPEEPGNKLEEFIKTIGKTVEKLTETSNKLSQDTDKLTPVITLLDNLRNSPNNTGLFDVAYDVLNLLGLVEENKFPDGDYILIEVAVPEGYVRSSVCYTLHVDKNGKTTAQRGILTPMLLESGEALTAYLAKLNPNVQKILGSVKSTAQGSIDTMSSLWNGLNQFSLTKKIAGGIRNAIIADVAAAVYRVAPGYFRNVNDVVKEINAALTQIEKLDKTPTFDQLLDIAESLIAGDLGEPVEVNTDWKFYNIAKPAEKAA